MCIYPKTCTTYHDSFLMITKLLLPKPTKRGHFSAVCRKKTLDLEKRKQQQQTHYSQMWISLFSTVLQLWFGKKKKGEKKLQLIHFRKNQLLVSWKKEEKLLHSSEKKRKMKKRYHKKHKLIIKRKKVWSSLNRIKQV